MTKAERIRQLAAHGIFSTKEIAGIVADEFGSCLPEYVRVCARQRVSGPSVADQRYDEKYIGQYGVTQDGHRYRINPERRLRSIKSASRWQRENRDRYNAYERERYARRKSEREFDGRIDHTSASPDARGE